MAKNGFKISTLTALGMGIVCLKALIQPEKIQKKLGMSPHIGHGEVSAADKGRKALMTSSP